MKPETIEITKSLLSSKVLTLMRPYYTLAFILPITLSAAPMTNACSSFAVYGKQTIFGMNFDYLPNTQQKISITSEYQGRVFHLSTRAPFGFIKIVGMNTQGLFASSQMMLPEESLLSPDSRHIYRLASSTRWCCLDLSIWTR